MRVSARNEDGEREVHGGAAEQAVALAARGSRRRQRRWIRLTVSDIGARRVASAPRCARSGSTNGEVRRSCGWSRTRRCRSPAPGETLIQVTRAGVNFADTHARENAVRRPLRAAADPRRRGGGRHATDGEPRGRAIVGTGGYAEYVTAPRHRFPIPDGVDDGAALALLMQGLTAWHLYRTVGAACSRRVRRGGRPPAASGSLAVQLGKALGARARDRHRLAGGEARARAGAGRRRRGRRRAGGPRRAPASRPTAASRSTWCFETAGGRVFDACMEALAPFGRMVAYGISSREQNEVAPAG